MRKRHSRQVSLIVFAVVICISVVLDRITKSLAETYLSERLSQPFILGFLDFRLVYNTGAAWGMLEGQRAIFVIIASITVVAMFIYIAVSTKHAAFEIIALGLVTGGAIGNGIDRIMSGSVVDFIHTLFIEFPLFNLADCSITVGVILFIIVLLYWQFKAKADKKTSRATEGRHDPSTEERDNASL